jgi:hypothetical protein
MGGANGPTNSNLSAAGLRLRWLRPGLTRAPDAEVVLLGRRTQLSSRPSVLGSRVGELDIPELLAGDDAQVEQNAGELQVRPYVDQRLAMLEMGVDDMVQHGLPSFSWR